MLVNHIDELHDFLDASEICENNVCIVGSSILASLGLRVNEDLDFAVAPGIRYRIDSEELPSVLDLATERYLSINVCDRELLTEDRYTDEIQGIKIARPELCLSLKAHRRADKDLYDIELFDEHLNDIDDWDWDIFWYDYSSSHTEDSLIQRAARSLTTRGIGHTATAVAQFLRSTAAARSKSKIESVEKRLQQLRGRPKPVHPSALLAEQYQDGEFCRYDIVIDAYEKLADNNRRFYQSNHSDDEADEDENLPAYVAVDSKLRVLDKAALIRYLKRPRKRIPIRIKRGETAPLCNREWANRNEEILAESATLDMRKETLFNHAGMYPYLIVWPPVSEHFEEIARRVGTVLPIRKVETIDLGSEFEEFVEMMYRNTDVSDWKIEYKKHRMSSHGREIMILNCKWPQNPNPTPDPAVVDRLKSDIRDTYVPELDTGYYFLIIHGPETLDEVQWIRMTIEEYSTFPSCPVSVGQRTRYNKTREDAL